MLIQKYNLNAQKLERPYSYKIRRFLELGCIVKIGLGLYECRPIQGYNITTYQIKIESGYSICNCQGFNRRKSCSHSQAVDIYRQQKEGITQRELF